MHHSAIKYHALSKNALNNKYISKNVTPKVVINIKTHTAKCKQILPDVQSTEVNPAKDVVTANYHTKICDKEILPKQNTLDLLNKQRKFNKFIKNVAIANMCKPICLKEGHE